MSERLREIMLNVDFSEIERRIFAWCNQESLPASSYMLQSVSAALHMRSFLAAVAPHGLSPQGEVLDENGRGIG